MGHACGFFRSGPVFAAWPITSTSTAMFTRTFTRLAAIPLAAFFVTFSAAEATDLQKGGKGGGSQSGGSSGGSSGGGSRSGGSSSSGGGGGRSSAPSPSPAPPSRGSSGGGSSSRGPSVSPPSSGGGSISPGRGSAPPPPSNPRVVNPGGGSSSRGPAFDAPRPSGGGSARPGSSSGAPVDFDRGSSSSGRSGSNSQGNRNPSFGEAGDSGFPEDSRYSGSSGSAGSSNRGGAWRPSPAPPLTSDRPTSENPGFDDVDFAPPSVAPRPSDWRIRYSDINRSRTVTPPTGTPSNGTPSRGAPPARGPIAGNPGSGSGNGLVSGGPTRTETSSSLEPSAPSRGRYTPKSVRPETPASVVPPRGGLNSADRNRPLDPAPSRGANRGGNDPAVSGRIDRYTPPVGRPGASPALESKVVSRQPKSPVSVRRGNQITKKTADASLRPIANQSRRIISNAAGAGSAIAASNVFTSGFFYGGAPAVFGAGACIGNGFSWYNYLNVGNGWCQPWWAWNNCNSFLSFQIGWNSCFTASGLAFSLGSPWWSCYPGWYWGGFYSSAWWSPWYSPVFATPFYYPSWGWGGGGWVDNSSVTYVTENYYYDTDYDNSGGGAPANLYNSPRQDSGGYDGGSVAIPPAPAPRSVAPSNSSPPSGSPPLTSATSGATAGQLLADRYVGLGDIYFRLGHYENAVECYKRAVSHDPNDANVHFILADALFAIGDYGFTASEIVAGLALNPALVESTANKREFYANPADFDLHIRLAEAWLAERPRDTDAWMSLGYNYYFQKEYKRAREAFTRSQDTASPTVRRASELFIAVIDVRLAEAAAQR